MSAASGTTPTLVVEGVGPLASVQDRGRPGYASQGVGVSGAADRASAALANRLVGNDRDAALIEILFGGLALRAVGGAALVVVAGAPCGLVIEGTDGRTRTAGSHEVVALGDGELLRVGHPAAGIRSYLAVHGGLAVPTVLGSRSWDSLAGLGPAPLAAGDVLPVGVAEVDAWPLVGAVPPPWGAPTASGATTAASLAVLDALLGPRDDWFAPSAIAALRTGVFEVTAQADRVGVRLAGAEPLERAIPGELPSEPVALGSVQVPAEGHPIVFLADHPVTGGYPVIAVLTDAAVDRAAQLAPGQPVRFRLHG